jgi:hypothetical protein
MKKKTAPHVLAARFLAILLASLAFSFWSLNTVFAGDACGPLRPSNDSEELLLLRKLNEYRVQRTLPALRISPKLNGIASWTVDDLVSSGQFGHEDSRGRSPYLRAVECGYSQGAGENLAAGLGKEHATDAFEAWKASTGHNANMLNRYFTEIGIARVYRSASRYEWYWAIEFGSGSSTLSATQPEALPPSAATIPTTANTPVPAEPPLKAAEVAMPTPRTETSWRRSWQIFLPGF